MLERTPVECKPYIWINPDKQDFFELTTEDIRLKGYPRDEIKGKNPQLTFELGI